MKDIEIVRKVGDWLIDNCSGFEWQNACDIWCGDSNHTIDVCELIKVVQECLKKQS